ncbi:putative endo-beta-1,4-glucanase D [Lachnellula subtilissima]|uniref:AA9 family lytic polysaccharide monooxygenase n=1 Tax=Lachnellula subtilissima TaxID=602034 RepID=A0A8H8RVY4_9HELO|nr:putative endo-beta-1,4-glucanase D [Lachnellula subtilissima]
MKFQNSFLITALLGVVSSHTIFTQLTSGGTTNGIGVGIREPTYDGPIQDVTSSDIVCNGGPNPTTASSSVIDVAAGSSVSARWRHTQTSGSDDVIDASHKGPVMAYLKKVSSATSDTGIGDGWFKISEAGLNTGTGKWATEDLVRVVTSFLHQAPPNTHRSPHSENKPFQSLLALPPGNTYYALSSSRSTQPAASSSGGAQFYLECAQINITGGSGSKTPATVSFPGAYAATDPGILINIYQTLTNYTIPGPATFTC